MIIFDHGACGVEEFLFNTSPYLYKKNYSTPMGIGGTLSPPRI